MKRSYYETDRAIPGNLLDSFPKKRQQLLEIQSQEKQIQHLIGNYKRKKIFQNCQEKILNKILRVFIRHQFVPSPSSTGVEKEDDRAYYLLTIEGRLLDLNYNDDSFPFGLFFDSIRIQIDKRYNASSDSMIYEWRRDQFLAGKKANCFEFKIFCDKPVPIKIYFARSDYATKRYELGIALRDLLPSLRTDPTEDEVFTAVWQYIELHSAYDFSSTRPLLRCDEKLRAVLGGDTVPLSCVRNKILESMHPARPIAVDYTLLMDETPTLHSTEINSKSIIKAGGRVFDLSVDILDPVGGAIVADINRLTSLELQIEPTLVEVERRAEFIVTSLRHINEEIEELHRIAACPIPSDLLSENQDLSMAAIGVANQRAFVHPILGAEKPSRPMASGPTSSSPISFQDMNLTGTEFLLSLTDPTKLVGGRESSKIQMTNQLGLAFNGLHSQTVFADVSNDALFVPSLPWMQRHREIGGDKLF